jgi:hypothetical protein
MTVIAHITVSQAATVMNACIAIVQYTIGVALVVLLVYIMRNANSAISWSSVSRTLHSSYWPDLLHADSASSRGNDVRVQFVSILTTVSAILLVASSVITPLGLKNGSLVLSSYSPTSAVYVSDSSPIGQATPPRDLYTYGRICGSLGPVPCPGNGDSANTTAIAPSIIDTFSSTPYGPFNMQFRRYYLGQGGYNYSMALSTISLTQSLVLRDDIFAVDGLIVDLTANSGVGLWNHTLPAVDVGGTWSHDVVWLEPQTSCVNTNLTIDYALGEDPYEGVDTWRLTDRGGFANLSIQDPEYSRDGQNIDLYAHAYKGAWLANSYMMVSLGNLTRNESYVGKTFPANDSTTFITVGTMQFISPSVLLNSNITVDNQSPGVIIDVLCEGYGGADTANITNVAVHCTYFLGPPQRTDGGDPRLPSGNSTWTQDLYVCASATRAKMQSITFSFNGTSELSDVDISREDSNGTSGLWAMENADIDIGDVDLFWGRVDDAYENNPTLSTTRSDVFYIPAGSSDIWGVNAAGQPTTVVGASWSAVYDPSDFDYSGSTNYALLNKWQSALQSDPLNGAAYICNSIWTDLMANNLVGNNTSTMIMFAKYEPSITFDYVYGIPAFLLLLVWTPVIFVALFALVTRGVTLSHLLYLLNQTSVGRTVLGDSALKAVGPLNPGQSDANQPSMPSPVTPTTILPQGPGAKALGSSQWAKSTGRTLVAIGGSQGLKSGDQGWLLSPGAGGEDEKKLDKEDRILRQKRLSAALANEAV